MAYTVERRKPKELTFRAGEDEEPVYSPNGKWIAFLSNRDLAEERHIWIVPTSGGAPHRLTHLQGFELDPVWTTDSESLRFQWHSTLGESASYSVEVSGKEDPRLLGTIHHSKFVIGAALAIRQ